MSERDQDGDAETTMPIGVFESWLPQRHPLHRPRHGRTQRTALVCAVAFLLLPAVAFAVGVRPQQIENRKLTEFPGIAHGFGMFTGLDKWATDNLPLRAAGVRAENAISHGVFGELPPKGSGSSGPFGPASGPSSGEDRSQVGRDRNQYPEVIPGKDGWLYYGWDVSMKCVTARPLGEVVASLRRFQRIVRESGRKAVVLVPPDKSTALPEHMPKHYAGKRCMTDYRRKFWPKVTEQGHVLDVRSRLRKLRETDPDGIYFKNDTHWKDRSAISALRAVTERLQPGVSEGWQTQKVDTVRRPGDLSRLAGQVRDDPWTRYRILPDGRSGKVTQEPSDLRNPTTVHNEPKPGMIDESTVILGDSFSRSMDRYAAGTFADATFAGYQDVRGGVNRVQHMIVDKKVVVLEMLERGVASGDTALLQPKQLDKLERMLKRHPK